MKKIAIIGGGISGLAALHFLRSRYADSCEVILYEKENRLGGTIGTDRISGYSSDWGPNGFLDKVPLTLKLVDELGFTDKLERANPKSENRFIYRNAKLHAISASPLKFLRSPLLSAAGRIRLISEPFRKAKEDDSDESVFDFASRRIGTEAAENLIVPMVSGIFGGDARKLSLKSCFPIMKEMEREYGSLFRAMLAKRKKKGGSGGPAGPSGRLTSFQTGLYSLIEKINELYAEFIETGAEALRIERTDSGFRLSLKERQPLDFDAIICSTPSYVLPGMLREMDKSLASLLDTIPYASISVVCLGYNRNDIAHDLSGFGFLIPRSEGKRLLGSIWTSSIFEGRSPDGMVQLRSMIGGATDPEAVDLSDGAMLDLVHGELSDMLGITGKPSFVRIFKWKQGIPQFELGHPDKLARLAQFGEKYPGLAFTGNAYDGIGLNDCVVRSDKVVTDIAKFLGI
ncbi:MAG: protoporphyrinogen oxidase [Candidatus Zixiibacteriota bacterium]